MHDLQILDTPDLPALLAYLATAPIEHVTTAARLAEWSLGTAVTGNEAVACPIDRRWAGVACKLGGAIFVHAPDPRSWAPLSTWIASRLMIAPQLIAREDAFAAMLASTLQHLPWPIFFDHRQHVLALRPDELVAMPPAPAVRQARPEDLALVSRMAVGSMRDELGLDPRVSHPEAYDLGIAEEIRLGRFYLWEEDGQPRFLVGVAGETEHAIEVTSVYTPPLLRGKGLAKRGLAEVCRRLFARTDTIVCVVNDDNGPARGAYQAIGFRTAAPMRRTVMWRVHG